MVPNARLLYHDAGRNVFGHGRPWRKGNQGDFTWTVLREVLTTVTKRTPKPQRVSRRRKIGGPVDPSPIPWSQELQVKPHPFISLGRSGTMVGSTSRAMRLLIVLRTKEARCLERGEASGVSNVFLRIAT